MPPSRLSSIRCLTPRGLQNHFVAQKRRHNRFHLGNNFYKENTSPSLGQLKYRFFSSSSSLLPDDGIESNRKIDASESREVTIDGTNQADLPVQDVDRLQTSESWVTPYLNYFAEKTKFHVDKVLHQLSLNATTDDDAADSINVNKRIERRWNAAFKKEMDRHYYRIRNQNQLQKLSIDQLWDAALQNMTSLPIVQNAPINHDDHISLCSDEHHKTHDIEYEDHFIGRHISPIFELPLNEYIEIEDLNSIIETHEEEDWEQDDVETHINTKTEQIVQFKSVNGNSDLYVDTIFRAISLLMVLKSNEWQIFNSIRKLEDETIHEDHEEPEKVYRNDDEGTPNASFEDNHMIPEIASIDDQYDFEVIHGFLEECMERKYALPALESNLLLSHLVVALDRDPDSIVDKCLQIYNEMEIMGTSGHNNSAPDSITYRILMLAFNQRFMAPGETIKLSNDMMRQSSLHMTPEVFLEAMKACQEKMDLETAREFIYTVIKDRKFRPTLGSCMIFVEMLKNFDMRNETIEFYDNLEEADIISEDAKDKFLLRICRWPRKNRRGDLIDLSSLFLDLVAIMERRIESKERPGIFLWSKLVEEIHLSAKADPSLWDVIIKAMDLILMANPSHPLNPKLVSIGLEASSMREDPSLASKLVQRIARSPLNETSVNHERSTSAGEKPFIVPYKDLKAALETCLRASDAVSAESILNSMNVWRDQYPLGAKAELYAIVLFCHAKKGDVESAKRYLLDMIDKKMNPGEELYAAVIHSSVVSGQYGYAEQLFRSMCEKEIFPTPGVASYDAIILGRIRARKWDGVISLYNEMKANGIIFSPQTVQGFLLAYEQKGGQLEVSEFIESLLKTDEARFGESTFRLVSKSLFQTVDENLDDFRQKIRDIGGSDSNVRKLSLDVVRTVRIAEIEGSRCGNKHTSVAEIQDAQEKAWKIALSKLLALVKVLSANQNKVA